MIGEIHLKTKSICISLAPIFTSHLPKGGLSTLKQLLTVIQLNAKVILQMAISHMFHNPPGHDWHIDLF